jgi:hypothetical protein
MVFSARANKPFQRAKFHKSFCIQGKPQVSICDHSKFVRFNVNPSAENLPHSHFWNL